ncbi:MAG: cytochrome b/b6 domain-containing protein [Betaproteobacteria bacterium]|nr:cytochrome b/b6 domain-containing protein [Betaproteobacteria bacterium]MDE2057019.1 cytochrome b/b6 domain-containing protein [Betaproteobacteria bacterium]
MNTTSENYTYFAKLLHWLIAGLILFNGLLALSDEWWGESTIRPIINFHKSLGITVLLLVILRILWRVSHQAPAMPTHLKIWEKRLAVLGHTLLYLLILLVPLSGWLHDSAWKDASTHPMTLFGLISWPRIGFIMNLNPVTKENLHHVFGVIHTTLNYSLYGILFIHIAAVYKHERIDKISVLSRMSFKSR